MYQRGAHAGHAGELFQVDARFREAQAAHADRPHSELAPDEVVERDALGDEVAPGLVFADVDVVFGAHRVDGLALDERHVARAATGVGVRAGGGGVAVVAQATPAIASMRSRASIGAPAAGAT